ncbi:MAG: DUF2071 domain-containing protein [Verrucomicrobiota bacterium]
MRTSISDDQRLAAREPPPDEQPVMRQRWEDLLFLHWKIPVPELESRLPPGLHLDTFEGSAYLGIVPFLMRKVYPVPLFPVPWISDFLELNVRTYVLGPDGIPGVWFFSLDANQPIAVEVARRWYSLNYRHAAMTSIVTEESARDYRCRRLGEREQARFTYPLPHSQTTALAEPGTLEFFLLERYLLYAWSPQKVQLFRGRVAHEPYRFSQIHAETISAAPARWEGFDASVSAPPCHQAVAQAVNVRAYPLQAISSEPRPGKP